MAVLKLYFEKYRSRLAFLQLDLKQMSMKLSVSLLLLAGIFVPLSGCDSDKRRFDHFISELDKKINFYEAKMSKVDTEMEALDPRKDFGLWIERFNERTRYGRTSAEYNLIRLCMLGRETDKTPFDVKLDLCKREYPLVSLPDI